MNFSYSAAWNDTTGMLRANSSLLLAIAGAFFFLPAVLVGYFFPQPENTGPAFMSEISAYFREVWPWLLLANIVNMIGAIAIYLLLFEPRGRTVGSAIGGALPILPLYFILQALTGIMIGFGFVLLILPGIYLLGRVAMGGPVMIAEGRRNPFDAIRGSFARSRGNGWAVAGLIVIVFITGYLLLFAVTAVLGTVFLLIGGRDGLGGLLVLILGAALTAALSTVMTVLFAAIYRTLSGPAATTTSGT